MKPMYQNDYKVEKKTKQKKNEQNRIKLLIN